MLFILGLGVGTYYFITPSLNINDKKIILSVLSLIVLSLFGIFAWIHLELCKQNNNKVD